ncbi:hypothetical protein [Streptomyces gibsoniae]|uniref:Chaplin n=1 Tax=Streptomyces gibsoniae TaxID=3075529 RepID=A0ABU2TYY0_9ACTN|nr:hypothetical protein [Streptomyces sp. DSM 41699]MDT0466151.1 hypothetical protein [Streptomyces sp. DSM 41699]
MRKTAALFLASLALLAGGSTGGVAVFSDASAKSHVALAGNGTTGSDDLPLCC